MYIGIVFYDFVKNGLLVLVLVVFMDFLGFSIYKIMSFKNRYSFISFLIWMPFISFSCLIALNPHYKAENIHPWLVPDLRKKGIS